MRADKLSQGKCKPCEGDVEPLDPAGAREFLMQLPEWRLEADTTLVRAFRFSDFRKAQSWLGHVADIAESENHHPDIHWSYNRVTIELTTHSIGGLSENDFILAAKIDELG
jgi:4a-hydroxytetrahydrobiopterin dehydratase